MVPFDDHGEPPLRRAEILLEEGMRLCDQQTPESLDHAIEVLEQASGIFESHNVTPAWGTTQYELGLAYFTRLNGDPKENLALAIAHYEKAARIVALHEFPNLYAMVHQNLASALCDFARFDRLNPVHFERAVQEYEEALRAHEHRAGPMDWASVAIDLSKTYLDRVHGSRSANVEEAVRLLTAALGIFTAGAIGPREAHDLRSEDNLRWNDRLVDLALVVRQSLQRGQERYTRVDFLRDRASTLLSLGNALHQRLSGDLGRNLEEAINAHLEAFDAYGDLRDRASQAMVANNLGSAFSYRILGRPFDNWRQSIYFYRGGLALHQEGSPAFEVAQTEQNLGATLCKGALMFPGRPRAERSAEIEEAIHCLRSALRVRTQECFPYHWGMTLSMLASAYVHRLEGDPGSNLDEAIALYEQVLRSVALDTGAPLDRLRLLTNLGEAYFDRIRGDRRANLEQAAIYLRDAVDGLRAAGLFKESIRGCAYLADSLVELERKDDAVVLLSRAVESIESSRAESHWALTRGHWVVHMKDLVERLVKLSWGEDRLEALLWSERGRGRALAETLIGRRRRPAGVSASEYQAYVALKGGRDDLEHRLEETGLDVTVRRVLVEKLRETQARIAEIELDYLSRDHSWSSRVSPPQPADLLAIAARAQASILVLRLTEWGTYAWLLAPDGKVATERFGVPTSANLRRFLLGTEAHHPGWIDSYAAFKDGIRTENEEEAFQKWLDTMMALLGDIWNGWLGNVHEFVSRCLVQDGGGGRTPSLIVVPSQSLGVVPLHAAWRKVKGTIRYWCDDFVIGYAPSIAALGQTLSASDGRRLEGLIAVANPTGDLPWAFAEAVHVGEGFGRERATIYGPPGNDRGFAVATIENVVRGLSRPHRVALFSCHGTWHAGSPWYRSGLFLHGAGQDPNLPLRDLAALDLGGCELAVLSACETGLSDAGDPTDEFVGLPAALLSSGASTVVGSLWTISDVATALVVTRAFRNLTTEHPLDPSRRLHEAQLWLRSATLDELRTAIREVPASEKEREDAIRSLESRGESPCAHPYWWAALECFGKP